MKNVAPRRLMGAPLASRPMVPRPQASMPTCSLRSKIPLENLRRNFDRSVAVVSECVGGTPSTAPSRGSLYQLWMVIHPTGETRPVTVSQFVSGEGATEGIRMNSA